MKPLMMSLFGLALVGLPLQVARAEGDTPAKAVGAVSAEVPNAALPDSGAKSTPITELDKQTEALMKGLDEDQTKQFAAIRNSHGVLRSVADVQASITRAVLACGKANPDLKDKMEERFTAWRDAVRPVIKSADAKLDKMVLLQGFAKPSVVRAYLKQFDLAVAFRNSGIKEVPVSDKDSCESLMKSMDDTQSNLIKLLKENLALDDLPVSKP